MLWSGASWGVHAILVSVAVLIFVWPRWTSLRGEVGFGAGVDTVGGFVWAIVVRVFLLKHEDARVSLLEYSGGRQGVGCSVVIFVGVWWFGLRLRAWL